MKFYFDFACSGKPLKVKLLSAAIKFLYKWFSKSLCKFLARGFPTRTFTYSFRSRHPILPIVSSPHTPCHFIPPCLSVAYSFPNCFEPPISLSNLTYPKSPAYVLLPWYPYPKSGISLFLSYSWFLSALFTCSVWIYYWEVDPTAVSKDLLSPLPLPTEGLEKWSTHFWSILSS